MEGELLERIIRLVARRIGLRVRPDDRETFRRKILARTKDLALAGPETYHALLLEERAASRAEWKRLIAILTTGESYFFRNQAQFALLKERILPELIERRKDHGLLRLWSAGCATGEEPYSIAILLDELLPALEEREPCILGTDINEEAVERARTGIFRAWSFRMVDPELRRRYFRSPGEEWELDARIRSLVRFQPLNLLEDPFPDPSSGIDAMDIIVCRNVFIYFSQEAIVRVVDKFAATLREGGYLLTGHGELHGVAGLRLRPRIFGEIVVYQKVAQPAVAATLPPLNAGVAPPPATPVRTIVARTTGKAPKTVTGQGRVGVVRAAVEPVPGKSRDPVSLLHQARACADAGKYTDAAGACREALVLDPTASAPYFLLAQIAEAQGESGSAKDLLRKAVYLAPDFVAAYLELAALYEREHDLPRAAKLRSTARELLQALPPQTVIEPYQDITAEELLAYLK